MSASVVLTARVRRLIARGARQLGLTLSQYVSYVVRRERVLHGDAEVYEEVVRTWHQELAAGRPLLPYRPGAWRYGKRQRRGHR